MCLNTKLIIQYSVHSNDGCEFSPSSKNKSSDNNLIKPSYRSVYKVGFANMSLSILSLSHKRRLFQYHLLMN